MTTTSKRYRKRPVVIEAIQFTGENAHEISKFMGDKPSFPILGGVGIPTLEGTMIANPGDWVIRGVKGEFYPCKPDIFEATYEEVPDDEG